MQDEHDNGSGWPRAGLREIAALLAVFLVGLALRVHGLGRFAYWEDELYSIYETEKLFWTGYEDGILARPLYFLLMNALGHVLPHSEWGLRLPALVFGTSGIVLAWYVARALAGPWAGLVTATALSLAPGHLFISTIHRYWSLVFLEGLAFAWLAIRALQSDRPRDYRRALAVWLVGAATHPLFLPVVAAVGLGSCVELAADRPKWRWPTRNALLKLWGPGLLVLLAAYGLISFSQGIRPVTQVGTELFPLAQRLRIAPAVVFGLTPIVAVGCVLGALRLRSSVDVRARRWVATTLLGAPVALAILILLSAYTPVTAIYASALTPLMFVAFGGLCAHAPRTPWPRSFGPGLLALTIAGMAPSTFSHLADGGRFDFRPAFAAIRGTDPSLPVLINPVAAARHYATDLQSLDLLGDGTIDQLEALRAAQTRFWLVLNERRHGISFDAEGKRLEFASRHCKGWGEFGRTRLDYEMYRVRLYLCDR